MCLVQIYDMKTTPKMLTCTNYFAMHDNGLKKEDDLVHNVNKYLLHAGMQEMADIRILLHLTSCV